MTSPTALHSSSTSEWFTPPEIIEAARECLGGINLDPASCIEANQTVKATAYFSLVEDGLSMNWWGNVFLNPPGGLVTLPSRRKLYKTKSNQVCWWRKLSDEYRTGNVSSAIFLGFSIEILQSAQGYGRWPSPMQYPFCIPAKRIMFSGAKAPSHSNVLVGLGVDPVHFKNCFRQIGECKT